MSFRYLNSIVTASLLVPALLCVGFVLLVFVGPRVLTAQEGQRPQAAARTGDKATRVARGKYIVEGLAGCGYCHTPRNRDGNPDRTRWLEGSPVFYEPARPMPGWPTTAPRLAGSPPGSDAELIRLLTTSTSRTGQPPRWPMPRFYMTRTDAEAVVAYLRSLNVNH
jgi:mono/diheme cytochrome c family protein